MAKCSGKHTRKKFEFQKKHRLTTTINRTKVDMSFAPDIFECSQILLGAGPDFGQQGRLCTVAWLASTTLWHQSMSPPNVSWWPLRQVRRSKQKWLRKSHRPQAPCQQQTSRTQISPEKLAKKHTFWGEAPSCLLYTSDAADE